MNKLIIIFISLFFALTIFESQSGVPYYIFSIKQNVSMGEENEKTIKNYYVNLGLYQGVKQGSILEVTRRLFRTDSYSSKAPLRIIHTKIGELIIEHADKNSSIASFHSSQLKDAKLIYDVDGFMLGDEVTVKLASSIIDPIDFLESSKATKTLLQTRPDENKKIEKELKSQEEREKGPDDQKVE